MNASLAFTFLFALVLSLAPTRTLRAQEPEKTKGPTQAPSEAVRTESKDEAKSETKNEATTPTTFIELEEPEMPVEPKFITAKKPAPPAVVMEESINDPFFGGDNDMEKAELRKAAHAALSRCAVLARGAARGGGAVMIMSINGRRGTVVKVGDVLTLNVDDLGLQVPTMAGAAPNTGAAQAPLNSSGDVIDLRVIEINRQNIRFELPDGSHITR